MKPEPELHKELRKWLEAVIRQRDVMIRRGVSKKNAYSMAENMEFLRRRLDHFNYDNDYKISLFFQQNKPRILSLLPGAGSGIYDKRMCEYGRFEEQTRQIITQGNNPKQRIAKSSAHLEGYTHGGLNP